ncbi:hypothetical protein Tsubulata_015165 [Turnera subulata]|uniref:DUF7866 domain-containing protein n=1 Tax=Turnera subulata TaxID=218843 RepID=A0A9Q0FRN7_9ROSI|nr:hypothetical protein Tsubulata_015165 [Turnera subulata]
MSAHLGFSLSLLLLLPLLVVVAANLIILIEATANVAQVEGNGSGWRKDETMMMVPVEGVEMRLMLNESSSRRRLNGFQICGLCTCCGGSKGVCLESPCCYAINCNIPNRPFGFCSFTPKSCNCFGCHL